VETLGLVIAVGGPSAGIPDDHGANQVCAQVQGPCPRLQVVGVAGISEKPPLRKGV
jgi:hypothetical protein